MINNNMLGIYRTVLRKSAAGEQVSSSVIKRAEKGLVRYCIDGLWKLDGEHRPVLVCADGSDVDFYSYRNAQDLFERLLKHPSGPTYLVMNSERIQKALQKQDLESAPIFS